MGLRERKAGMDEVGMWMACTLGGGESWGCGAGESGNKGAGEPGSPGTGETGNRRKLGAVDPGEH